MITLHKLPQGYVLCSDEEIKEGDNVLDNVNRIWINMEECFVKAAKESSYGKSYKIICLQDQLDFSELSEEDQKRIGWFNVDKLAFDFGERNDTKRNNPYADGFIAGCTNGYKEGFQKAQQLLSDRLFTLEDLERIIIKVAYDVRKYGYGASSVAASYARVWMEENASFIQKKSDSWEVEVETIQSHYTTNGRGEEPKIIRENYLKFVDGKIKILKVI